MNRIAHPLVSTYLCPMDLLLRAGKLGTLPVVIAAANADHVLKSVGWARSLGLIEPILVGDAPVIERLLQQGDNSLGGVRVMHAEDDGHAARIAVQLVRSGEAKLLMKGQLHTDVLMREVLSAQTGLRQARRLSHIFAMIWPGADGYLLITDAALNIAPDAATLPYIVRHAIAVAQALKITHPRIAMLAATEEINPAMQSSVAAAAFAKSFHDEAALMGCKISGPLALDVAISKQASGVKGLHNDEVAGSANILVVPNIETGNSLFKLLVHANHATAIGVVLGAGVPIILNSRADSAEAKLASIALARIIEAERMSDKMY